MSKATITIVSLGNAVATTTTIDAAGITNTEVYTGTDAGFLSATVTVTEGGTAVPDASVTWSSSNNAVATIDAATGAITLVDAGSVTFTASYEGVEDEYLASSGTYEMTVTNSDPNAPGTVNNPYTVAQAIANTPSNGNVYIRGIVSSFYNTSITGDGSNYRYYISDDGSTTTQLIVYKGKGLNQATFTNTNDLLVGDEVVIYGTLSIYQNNPQVNSGNYLYSWSRPAAAVEAPTFSPAAGTYADAQTVTISCETQDATIYYTIDGTEPTNASTEYTAALTIATATTVKAIAYVGSEASTVSTAIYHICSADNPYTVAQALDFNEYPANGIYVHGIVSTAPTSLNNGTLTYYISEDGEAEDELEIYKGKNLENTDFTAVGDIQVGDIVTIYGNVKIYNNFKEFDQGNYIVSFERPVPVLEPYDLTVSTLNEHINAIYVFDANNQNDPLIEEGLAGTVQVLEGTDIIVSPDVEAGYVLTALTVLDGEGESVQPENHMSEGGYYSFTMPSGPVTISATAVEAQDYELFNSDLVEGDYIIYYNGYALKNTAVNSRLSYETVSPEEDVIATGDATIVWHIVPSATEGYWTIYSADAEAYAASTGVKNKAQMLENGTDDKALWSVTVSSEGTYEFANKNNYEADPQVNYLLRNNGTNGWACYASATGGALYLYKKVVPSQYEISFVTNSAEIGELIAGGNSSVSLPEASIEEDGWEFAGWSQSFVLETTTEPALVTNPYTVTDNVVLYAVYKKEQSSSYTYNSHPSDVQIVLDENSPSYTIDFETATAQTYWTEEKPAGWSLVWIEAPRRPSRRSQIVYEPVYARGDYYLRMDSLNIYAMPAVNVPVNTLQMELYVRQQYVCHQLEVGVLEATDDDGGYAFKPVATVNNNTPALERRVVDFSGYVGDGRRIAFRNVYNAGDYGLKSFNFIDDITLSLAVDNSCDITDLEEPYTLDFEMPEYEGTADRTGVTLDCWTLVQHDVIMNVMYEPQIYRGYAHGGDYTLMLDGRCIYAMPKIDVDGHPLSHMQLEFFVRQSSASCQLVVGVMSDVNNPSTFVGLDTISNNGVSGQQRHRIEFSTYANTIPDGAKYIAFHNIYDGTWGRSPHYIDDLTLSLSGDNFCDITDLDEPYTEDFELSEYDGTAERTGVTLDCWTLVQNDYPVTALYEPQIYKGYAHGGRYTLMLDGRCLYAMPKIDVEGYTLSDMQLEFFVRQSSASCQLVVGVMSDVNNPSTFVGLDTISNNGVSGQQRHRIEFSTYANTIPNGAKYIAFRNVYDGTWGRSPHYLDDLTLSLAGDNSCDITNLDEPYTEDFELSEYDGTTERTGVTLDCWTLVQNDYPVTAIYEPQIYKGYAHGGRYTLMLDGRCLYAMPKIDVEGHTLSDMQLEFYVRQYSANCKLVLGVMSDVNNPSTFVELDTISNNGVPGQQGHLVDFSQYANSIPADAKYIAFRNIYSGTWGRSPQYLDDIILSVPEAKIAEVSGENEIDAMGVERYLEDIRVYPNPTRGNLYIDAMDVQKVECYNQMGQLVGVYDNANELNIGDLSDGVYMLRITVPQGVTMRKVVKK